MADLTSGRSEEKFPKYSSLVDRLMTFISWPRSSQQKPRQLAEAGFFYKGYGDRVICYSCGEEVSGWSDDDNAWVKHAKRNPTCRHVKQHKMVVQGQSVRATNVNSNNYKREEEEVRILRRRFRCKTCDKERNCMVLLPFGRLWDCEICAADTLENCNVCNMNM